MTKPSDILGKKPEPKKERESINMSVSCFLCNSQSTVVYKTENYGKFQVDCSACGRTSEFNLGWEPGV